jgi:DNA polymerase III delta prime subunit
MKRCLIRVTHHSEFVNYMARLVLVCGPTGVGKTTHSLSLADEIKGVKFSIDPWMQTLFSKDMTELDFEWMMPLFSFCLKIR